MFFNLYKYFLNQYRLLNGVFKVAYIISVQNVIWAIDLNLKKKSK